MMLHSKVPELFLSRLTRNKTGKVSSVNLPADPAQSLLRAFVLCQQDCIALQRKHSYCEKKVDVYGF